MEDAALDAVDRAILYHLQRNARKPITDIADAVNMADNTVRNRIQAMEDDGVIRGYNVDIDYDRAGVQHYYVFVCSARVSEREHLVDEARQLPAVVEVLALMTGTKNVYVLGAGSQKDDITQLAYDLDGLGLEVNDEYLIRDHASKPFEEFRLDRNGQ
ncbi:Lrp/AsnC family transcriptional regulator [Natrinema amylolyticum]|uniref:Lrp/AsnC family transcriptional regulator n=1 Tax=Natrinema amylolyticum TaxID=2878679 RepID=UPI001CFB6B66|nr:AsnC family transcriptional regulator [Natrinema amylolyticum]